ncbi:ANTAR domain-containing response regulator [Aquipuribacter sp. SD81]|uniref:ANTAR domain-containing response regulator n=1 Tax=Aquipuribacter sp. SD81 TaxID=3127703 RepID=UPI00301AAB40
MPTPPAGPTADDADLSVLRDAVARLRDEVAGLQEARHRRAVIEQAKGALMATRGGDADEAFDHLRRVSRQSNRRVVDVAADELARLGAGAVRPVQATTTAGTTLGALADGRVHGTVEGALDGAAEAPADGAADDGAAGTAGPPRRATIPPLGLRPGRRDTPRAAPADRAAGEPHPRPTTTAPTLPSREERDRRLVLLEVAARGSATVDELARSFARLCSWPAPPDELVVQRIGAGGTLDLVAAVGFPADFEVRWHQVPLGIDMPVGHTGRTGEAVFVEDAAEVADRWPALAYEDVHACAVLPVVVQDVLVAVVGLGWRRATRMSGHDRRMMGAAVATVTESLVRLLPGGGVEPLLAGWTAPEEEPAVRTALDAVIEEAVLLLPVVAERDLRLVWWNDAARSRAGAVTGGRVSEVAPHVVGSDLWGACQHVLRHRSRADLRTSSWWWRTAEDGHPHRVRVASMWNGLLVARC